MKTDGSLWLMGDNRYGQLGNGDFISSPTPVQIIASGVSQVSCGRFSTFVKMSDGSAKVFGSDEYGQLGLGRSKYRLTPYQLHHTLLAP